ncbi:MAG: ABC1 kinase family protein, partial [Thermacetogeniaceae bacterium]
MQLGLRKRYKHLQRYRQIANILARHGFDFLLRDLELAQFLERRKKDAANRPKEALPRVIRAQRLRMVLEDLGPTFIKLGQFFSTRTDFLASEYIRELEKLQDDVPPFSYPEAKETIQMELGHPIEKLFTSFDRVPLAAASIGQVHRATLPNKQEVVVKIRRPGVEKRLATDLEILHDLARLADRDTSFQNVYSFRAMVEEFEEVITRELDFSKEGFHAEIFRKNFRDDPSIYIPEVVWDYTTPRVLTMEYVEGVKLTDIAEISNRGINRKIIARLLSSALLQMVLLDGFFHADPHPGNLSALKDDKLVFMDFGIVGHLSENLKKCIGDLVLGLINRNTSQVTRALTDMGVLPPDIDRDAFYHDVDRMREKYYEIPFEELKLADSINDVLGIASRHSIRIPMKITMLAKALVTAEGVSRQLDPELSLAEVARPFKNRLLARRFNFKSLRHQLMLNLADFQRLLTHLPQRLEQITELIYAWQLKIKIHNPDIYYFANKLNALVNRLVLSILLGSLIIGSSLL